jgi:septum formation protein
MKRPIVLASTSRYRRMLLDQLGLDYAWHAPDYDEDHGMDVAPSDMVQHFARGKATSLAAQFPDAVLIGSDQVAELDGAVLTKPGEADRAVAQLLALAGRTHLLHTAVAVHVPSEGRTEVGLTTHRMRMRPLTRALAEAYVARDQPLDCAGSYKVEALGAALFEAMDGPDHTAIVGLPLTTTARLLGLCGVDLLERVLSG